ncbi:pyridoxamine 5'-phosphate oxidase family protein [Streptomyces botrytidirepellens]|uniref:Pyridoxamine 5'-phosphate oxidase family protein n=1 Tax=Streptomyces botrytidirepellens TaxID=2486417 RepID=A0A3M8SL73_9ACTN|nr:pyridoxamine 5'-phosphate oxidase family protein [Streptomyces botrytidirepellens]RNF81405.1 pyridoxamine 5'-phosphate oxidase family protein [Streptomyces botrytidirepellens]
MTTSHEPRTELDTRFSSPDATATSWPEGRAGLAEAQMYWLSTVRPDGRPHVTPLIAVWLDGALYFCTGPDEQKARNLARNPHCVLATGRGAFHEGLDLVVEGDAAAVRDEDRLRRVAEAYVAKYGEEWRFRVRDGAFHHEGGEALVYEVAPARAFGFRKGEYSQTRWRF